MTSRICISSHIHKWARVSNNVHHTSRGGFNRVEEDEGTYIVPTSRNNNNNNNVVVVVSNGEACPFIH